MPGGDLRHNSHKMSASAMDGFVGAPAKPPQTKRKLSALQRSSQARQRSSQARQRMRSICLKSVDVRSLQVAILAQSPLKMSQTDRILPRYFLSRVRVSIRPRIFLYAKKTRTSRPLTDHASAPPTVRTAQFERQFIPPRQVTTYVTIHTKCPRRLWMVLLAPRQNRPRLRESYLLCKDPAKHGSDPAKRGSVCEEVTVPTPPSPRPSLAIGPGYPPWAWYALLI